MGRHEAQYCKQTVAQEVKTDPDCSLFESSRQVYSLSETEEILQMQ